MKIKHILLLLAFLLSGFVSNAQNIKHINVALAPDKSNLSYIELFTDNVVFAVSQNGNLKLTRNKRYPGRGFGNNSADMSRPQSVGNMTIEYYDNFNSNYAGKVKSVGNIAIAYNDQFDGFDNRGKVKSIGNLKLAYNDRFDGFDNRGKIKAIGDAKVVYYDRFDGSELNGKVKYIGNTLIKYYDRFDGADRVGRVKSITGSTPNISISNIDDGFDGGF